MNSYKTKLRSVTKRTTNLPAPVLKTKRSSVVSSTASNGSDALSRRQLVDALSQMGIVVPQSTAIDILRSFHDVSVKSLPSSLQSTTRPGGDDTIDLSTVHFSNDMGDDTDDEHADQPNRFIPATTVNDFNSDPRVPLQPSQSSSVKVNEQSKNFSLFSNPVGEEVTSVRADGIVERGHDDIALVPKGLRKAILEGYNVNLVRLLLPRETQKSNRDDDDDDVDRKCLFETEG